MEALLEPQKVFIFALCIFPGLVSLHVYRLIMPARSLKWESAILEGLFYSLVNFALCTPIWLLIFRGGFPPGNLLWFWLGVVSIFLVGPTIWPVLYLKALRSAFLRRHLQSPYSTAWDFFFGQRRSCFLLVHLTDGSMIGGFFGTESFASAFPKDGDIYINAVYQLDADGHFGQPVPNTRGVLLRKEDYAYIEVFDVPPETEPNNERPEPVTTAEG